MFRDAVEALIDHGERITRAAIREIPNGVYRASGQADGDGVSEDPVYMEVAVTVKDTDIWLDFAGSDKQRAGAAGNCHWVNTVSATREFMMFLTDTAVGGNEGSYKPIHIAAPAGAVFRPQHPAPVTTGIGDMCTRLIELLFRALAEVFPDKVIAGTFGGVHGFTLAGFDEKTGEEFVHCDRRCYRRFHLIRRGALYLRRRYQCRRTSRRDRDTSCARCAKEQRG